MIDIAITAILAFTPIQKPETVPARTITAIAAAADLPAEWEPFQRCVAERESHSNYRSSNRSSSAQGKYQFLDNSWRQGGAWNVWKSLIAHGASKREANRIRRVLMQAPIKTWRGHYQEILFVSVVTSRDGMGWRHWFLAGSPCNRLART